MSEEDRLEWFPCEPGPLLGALGGMRAPEGYLYMVVLLRIYECGGACPDTLDALTVRTRLNKRVVSDTLDSLFRAGRLYRGDGGIRNPKADRVIAESKALLQKRKTAGAIGGQRTAEKYKKNQQTASSKAAAQPEPRPRQRHIQDSLFTDVNRAQDHLGTHPEPKPAKPPKQPTALEIARKELFDRGKEVLGAEAGGMIQNLLAAKHGNVALARAAIEQASTMDNPRQYVGGIVRGGTNGTDRNGGGQKLGYAGIAQRVRSAASAAAPHDERDAGDHQPDDRHRSPPSSVGPLEGDRQAAMRAPIIDGHRAPDPDRPRR